MRNDYKYLFVPVQMPFDPAAVAYVDPVRTDGERRGRASRIAKQRAKLRLARLVERGGVLALSLIMAVTVLPVLLVVAISVMAGTLWRHSMQARGTAANRGADRRYSRVRRRPLPSTGRTFSVNGRTELPGFGVGNACAT